MIRSPAMIGMTALQSNVVAKDAARIEVPVFICMGERDVSPDPHAEVANYKCSRDIMLHILPRSGHCHNFASTRHQLWNRMHRWVRCISVENII